MAEKNIKSRIVHKHDTESNWSKAITFIPKQGEIIVYDIDSNHSYERIKVGDGATNVNNLPFLTQPITIDAVLSDLSENPVQNKIIKQSFDNLSALAKTGSWNDLKDKPFYKEIKEEVLYDNPSLTFTNGYSENLGVSFEGGKTYTIIFDNISYSAVASDGISLGDIFVPPTVTIDNVISINNANCHLLDNSSGTHSLKIIGNATTIKTLDSEFLPDNIDWGKITNAPFIKAGSGTNSIIENDSLNAATGIQSHAEGYQTHAVGDYSHVEGEYSTASGRAAHAEGWSNAEKDYSHAEGNSNAYNEYAHSEGLGTFAYGKSSHSEGQITYAYGDSSHAEGLETYADGEAQHVQGKFNVRDTENVYAHIVGGGRKKYPSNIHTLDWSGNGWFKGNVKIGGTSYDDISSKTLATIDDINNKVDKEDGKGLSTNDFTTAEKNKLAGIAKNANNYTLPVASSTLGGVKTTSTVTSTTGLTATPIINGVPYYKDTNTTYNNGTGISISNNKINHSNSVTAKTAYGSTATSASANGGSFTVTDIKYDAQGHITGSTDRTIKLSQTTYTLSGLGGVPTSRKVNGHALTADISLTASDVGAITGISGADVIDALGYTPANQENLGDFTGASATQAGDTGLVPAPSAGDQSKFLRGDGTWATVSTSGGITGDYLPLTGGTLTGNLTVNGAISVNTANRAATAENILADKGGVASDANTCLAVGVYATNTNTTNLPFATYGTLTVYKSAQNWIIQIWTSSTSAESSMYMRKNINGEGFGSWHKLLGSDSPVSIAQGGTGGTKLEEAQKNILDGTYPGEGTDLSKLAPGIYSLPNDSNTVANTPAVSWSPLAFVFGHQNNDTAADGSPTGGYFQGYLNWEGELWLRRRKWDGWGNWLQIISSNGGEINGGTLTVSKTSGFNYSGIEEGTSDAFRSVWFSDASAKGKPCYHNGLMYNPGTQDLAIGGHSVYHTGNIIYSSTQPSNASTGTIWLKPV